METCLTINVTFEGLGLCCFNRKRGGAELAFLRLPEHNLKIRIVGDDGRQKVFDGIGDDSVIELISTNAAIDKFKLNENGEFSRVDN